MDALKLLSRSTGLKAKIAKPSAQTIPSASGQGTSHDGGDDTLSRKRKRDSESENDLGQSSSAAPSTLTEDEVRQYQKKHKIKIVDLNRFRAVSQSSEKRKAQKEQSRIFPQPLIRFGQLRSDYKINPALAGNLAEQAYFEPTEVQSATLPLLLKASADGGAEPPNADLLTIAPTGSGKTLAFLIPLIEKTSRAHRQARDQPEKHVSSIILAPTKELVSQIVNEGRKLCAKTGVSITAMRKGMKIWEGHSKLEEGTQPEDDEGSEQEDSEVEEETKKTKTNSRPPVKADILVSTPLSLVHALCPSWEEDETKPPQALPKVETLIFDEADVLLDPLFRSQTLAVWSACTSPSLQISMWSATIGSNIEELAVSTISERQKRVGIPRNQSPRLLRTIIGLKDTSLPTISHRLTYTATEAGKLLGMRQLLHPTRSTTTKGSEDDAQPPPRPPFLVFTQTIARAQSLYDELQYDIPASAGGSSRMAVLHSSLPDHVRASIMQKFRQGKIWVLITTDLLSRGVDFRGVNVVVNYDIPTTVAGYVHRAGRTGRAGRQGGVCVSFYTKEDIQYVKGIANVIAASEKGKPKKESGDGDGNNTTKAVSATTVQPWLLHALPNVSKSAKKDLKRHGVESRRAIHADDDEKTKRMKRKARIGTQSGYERREVNRKRAAVQASLSTTKAPASTKERNTGGEWEGFG
ncbi:ATP-dependent RNA helicase rok1 [Exophiala dermatitidis]